MAFLQETWQRVALFLTLVLLLWLSLFQPYSNNQPNLPSEETEFSADSLCPLPERQLEINDGLDKASTFAQKSHLVKQVERLSAAVDVPTVSYDDNGDVDEDPRWKPFKKLHRVLEDLFPLVHKTAEVEKVNKYGLVYTLRGSSESVKPLLFMAHQDVVPAGLPEKWTHPPFEAYYDGQFLWGRGSSDCKNNLIGLLSAMESLLEQKWEPTRTIIFAFGFDEETGGERGNAYIAAELEKTWGRESMAMVMDEGGMGLDTIGDVVYALPAVAEKGYIDVFLTIDVEGGHSSRPPPHSGIGIMSEMIVALENHPFIPVLTRENPFRGFLECRLKYSPEEVQPWLRRALRNDEDGRDVGSRLAESSNEVRYRIQTSQAVDIINAGSKTNQLPETVTAVVNYRIAPHDSIASIKESIAKLLRPIAHNHSLAVTGFGEDDRDTGTVGSLQLKSKYDLQPSPISPTDISNPVWSRFAGVIRDVFENTDGFKGKTVVPVGDIMTGNTDTIHYWNLSRNIYRYSPARAGARIGVHTIDERMDMSAHIEGMMVYYDLIRSFDQAQDA